MLEQVISDKAGWTRVAFGDVVRLSKLRAKDPEAEGYERVVGLEHIEPGDLRIRRWADIADGTTFTSVFKPGQVLFGKRRAYQRKVAMPDFEGVCSGDIYVLEPSSDALMPELLPFICQTDAFLDHAVGTSAGSLSPRTNWKSLASFEFMLPPIQEQARLVECLQAADASLASLIECRTAASSVAEAILFDAIDRQGTVRTFSELGVDIIDGDRGKAYPNRSQLKPSGFCLFLNAKNVTNGGFQFNDCEFIDEQRDGLLRKGKLTRGDVVLTTRGTLGNVAFYDASVPHDHIRINSGMVVFRPHGEVQSEFLYYYMKSQSFQNAITEYQTGSAQPQLPIKDLVKMPFPDIPNDVQEKVIAQIRAVSESFSKVENRHDALVSVKEKLLFDLSNREI